MTDDPNNRVGHHGASKAVYFDRDGIINGVVMRGTTVSSPWSMKEFCIEPGVVGALSDVRRAGYLVFVVSNQPDVARGNLAPEVLHRMMAMVTNTAPIQDFRVCVHDDRDGCDCRKPRPGMVLDLAEQWGVDIANSFVVGDSWRDMECGRTAGCRTILIDRPYNNGATGDLHVANLGAAVDIILDWPEQCSDWRVETK